MTVRDNQKKYHNLQKEFPFFEYQSYQFFVENGTIVAEYCFNLSDKYLFKPVIRIPARDFYSNMEYNKSDLNNFVFHIGMVELVSYWKAACPPNVIVVPHLLDNEQVAWWKKLYFLGLGEFFYLNGINAREDSFMTITSSGNKPELSFIELDGHKVIVPIGGGKDSVVTLELLGNSNFQVIPMMVNPREASIRTIETAGYGIDQSIVINRTIDGTLLKLNELGFLNGHTPFSALLAFTSALSCVISGVSNIALSNESSANESTVPGSKINHQYSKTFEFESDFAWYIKKYVHNDINYFSFLRPVNELQIAQLFSKYPSHFDGFRSCNVGSKNDTWCAKCPKCLFTFIILSPFIDKNTLIDIFGDDMLNDGSIQKVLDELAGISEVKPFECVGTPDEVKAALKKFVDSNSSIPLLLKNLNFDSYAETDFESLLMKYNTEHLIPAKFETILKKALNDRTT